MDGCCLAVVIFTVYYLRTSTDATVDSSLAFRFYRFMPLWFHSRSILDNISLKLSVISKADRYIRSSEDEDSIVFPKFKRLDNNKLKQTFSLSLDKYYGEGGLGTSS